MTPITIDQIPHFNFMNTENNVIKFKIGKLKILSNESFKYIHNVEIEISEEIIISFKDYQNLIESNWKDFDFTNNQVDTRDYEFKYKTFTLIFKDFFITQMSSGGYRKAKAGKIMIKKGKINNTSEVDVFELIDKTSLNNGTFEYDNFKLDISYIKNHKIKENYNAEYSFSYECKYDELEEWEGFIWKVYLMLRFYTGNLLLPQTKIIIDKFNNFEIIFNGFDSFGEGKSIFHESINSFSKFLETSFNIFSENWEFYNLLITCWINIHEKNFVEINNLSGFLVFEILIKQFTSSNNAEFPDKLYQIFNLQNLNLKFFNELFFKEIIEEMQNIYETYQEKCPETALVSKIFEFYEKNFILFYIQYYRNKIVHGGEIDFKENSIPIILNKIHKKLEKIYLKEYELPKKTISDFKKEHENIGGSYWKGFRKGFKIGNELKTNSSQEYKEKIEYINDIYKTLNEYFTENIIWIMNPLEAFDNITTIFLIKLLNIDCTLSNEPKFNIGGEYIAESKEYISCFLNKDSNI